MRTVAYKYYNKIDTLSFTIRLLDVLCGRSQWRQKERSRLRWKTKKTIWRDAGPPCARSSVAAADFYTVVSIVIETAADFNTMKRLKNHVKTRQVGRQCSQLKEWGTGVSVAVGGRTCLLPPLTEELSTGCCKLWKAGGASWGFFILVEFFHSRLEILDLSFDTKCC